MSDLPREKKIGCAYRVSSEYVEAPEGTECSPDCGLLFDRQSITHMAPEASRLLSNRFLATTLPDTRAIGLFSEQCLQGVYDKLEELLTEDRDARRRLRLMVGFQSALESTCPLIIPEVLQEYADLSGEDVLIIYEQDYMEIWSDNQIFASSRP